MLNMYNILIWNLVTFNDYAATAFSLTFGGWGIYMRNYKIIFQLVGVLA